MNRTGKRVVDEIPDDWLDPLLSGPDGIGMPPYDCNDIERLLLAIKERIRAAHAKATKAKRTR